MAKGSVPHISNGKVSVTFGWFLMGKINDRARRERTSFSEAVRRCLTDYFDDKKEQI